MQSLYIWRTLMQSLYNSMPAYYYMAAGVHTMMQLLTHKTLLLSGSP
jgi:hypothetical protein